MHGPPEATGLALLESHQDQRIDGWDIEPANAAALEREVRYVEYNLITSFGGTDPTSPFYELRRPAELIRLGDNRRWKLDIHDRPDAIGEYAMISRQAFPSILGAAALLGIKDIIVTERPGTLVDHDPDVLVIEFCRDDASGTHRRIQQNVERLRRCMRALTLGEEPTINPNHETSQKT